MSKNASAAAAVDVSSETDAALTIVGGGELPVTLSASAISDTYTGGAGADNLTVAIVR